MTDADAEMLALIARDPEEAVRQLEARRCIVERITNPRAMWWECWLMQPNTPKGYVQVSNWKAIGDTPWAHRLVAAAVYGPIPARHDVDHICFTRNCVNPLHLRFLPARENRSRRRPPAIQRFLKELEQRQVAS